MALVRWAALALALSRPTAAAADIDRCTSLIAEASARFEIPENWIRRVMAAESGGRTHWRGHPIRSHAGAMGLMQVMPGTWRALRQKYRLGYDPDDPRDNILAGTAYLREMYDRFGYPGLFAAYNAGPARYERHRASGGRLPAETVAYVAVLTGGTKPAGPAPGAAGPMAPMFFVPRGGVSAPLVTPPADRSSLFVTLRSTESR